jgi:hypothetical protein
MRHSYSAEGVRAHGADGRPVDKHIRYIIAGTCPDGIGLVSAAGHPRRAGRRNGAAWARRSRNSRDERRGYGVGRLHILECVTGHCPYRRPVYRHGADCITAVRRNGEGLAGALHNIDGARRYAAI